MKNNQITLSCCETYWCLSDAGSATVREIAKLTGFAKRTVQKHLKALERAEVIQGHGKPKYYQLRPNSSAACMTYLRELELVARQASRARQRMRGSVELIAGSDQGTPIYIDLEAGKSSVSTYLFSRKEDAQEVAWILRANWDGLNAIDLPLVEKIALETASGQVGAEYCEEGDECLVRPRSFKSETMMYTSFISFHQVGGDESVNEILKRLASASDSELRLFAIMSEVSHETLS